MACVHFPRMLPSHEMLELLSWPSTLHLMLAGGGASKGTDDTLGRTNPCCGGKQR